MSDKKKEWSDLKCAVVAVCLVLEIGMILCCVFVWPTREASLEKQAAAANQKSASPRVYSDAEVGLVPVQSVPEIKSDLPSGVWASKLIHGGVGSGGEKLYEDAATYKFYYVQNGSIYEYQPYTPTHSYILSVPDDQDAKHQAQGDIWVEIRRANDIAESRARTEELNAIWAPTPQYTQPTYSTPIYTPVAPAYSPPITGFANRMGNTTFYNAYQGADSAYGTSTTIGNTTFHNYFGSDGSSVYGNTTVIGDTAYTTLYGN